MVNLTSIANNSIIPGDITNKIVGGLDNVILILKAIGVLILVYIVFLIIKWVADILRNRRIKKIYEKVNEIDEKVDMLLEKSKGKGEKKDRKGK